MLKTSRLFEFLCTEVGDGLWVGGVVGAGMRTPFQVGGSGVRSRVAGLSDNMTTCGMKKCHVELWLAWQKDIGILDKTERPIVRSSERRSFPMHVA